MNSLEQFMKYAYNMDPKAGNDNKKMMELFDQYKNMQNDKLDETQDVKKVNPDALTLKNYGSSNYDNYSSNDRMGSQMDFVENTNKPPNVRTMDKVNLQFNNSEQNMGAMSEGNLIIGADIASNADSSQPMQR